MSSIAKLFVSAAFLVSITWADIHHLFVGNLQPPASIHLLKFDDQSLTLQRTDTFTADASHAWIAFDHLKKNIYGASLKASRIASYSINTDLSLRLDNAINATGNCVGNTSAFVIPNRSPPYTVYTGAWPGPNACGMAISTLSNGTLSVVSQTWKYKSSSGIHGMALGRNNGNLYTADLSGDAVWTHKVQLNGTVEIVSSYPMPAAGMHPRHVAAHPNGNHVYVVMEAGNEVVAYSLNNLTGAVEMDVGTYSLIPDRSEVKGYWSAEVMLSPSSKLLWATARASQGTNNTGWISCFNLDAWGAVLDRIFILPTTTIGGIANAVSPATWSDEFMAMTDIPSGYVQVWQLTKGDETKVGKGRNGDGWTSANMVAQVDIKDGGCCANAIWYD